MPVFVNKRGVVHAGSGGQSIAPADVCLIPVPPGPPIPVPYPNIGMSADTSNGPATVTVEGKMPMVKGAEYSKSTGDQAGSAGGLMCGVTAGACEFILYAFDVKFEGQNVCRMGDPLFHNKKNAPGGIELGEPVSMAVAPLPGKLSKDNATLAGTLKSGEAPLKNWPFQLLGDGKPITPDQLQGRAKNSWSNGAWRSDANGKFGFEKMPEAYYAIELLRPKGRVNVGRAPPPDGVGESRKRIRPPAPPQFAEARFAVQEPLPERTWRTVDDDGARVGLSGASGDLA